MIISSTVLNHSISSVSNQRIASLELVYPRFILAELNTHRVFSKNSSSSRAIPVRTMIEMVMNSPAMPIHWGQNKPGMQADTEIEDTSAAKDLWLEAATRAVEVAKKMEAKGIHKQVVNRILEPFQWMKTVLTATEFINFYNLRIHKDAQPEINDLAEKIRFSLSLSNVNRLEPGQWHLPYVSESEFKELGLENALKVSASCCAQVSYRKNDKDLEKALRMYNTLALQKPAHASPFEHQATPMARPIQNIYEGKVDIEDGVTHIDIGVNAWSGNFKGWIQNRQLMKI